MWIKSCKYTGHSLLITLLTSVPLKITNMLFPEY